MEENPDDGDVYAYAAVLRGDKFGIGRADKDIKGYTPMNGYGPFTTWDEACRKADWLNAKLGLTPREAMMIVASTMKPARCYR